ncbi:MAG: hypothetical protein JWM90_2597 [Thermoleophilia bacterium]|nr:hypothetical protein [Thermoleophilia bacterium]
MQDSVISGVGCRARLRRAATARTLIACLALVVGLLLQPDLVGAAAWTPITNPGTANSAVAPAQDIAWDGTGLWVTWATETHGVSVKRWNGSVWTAYAAPVASGTMHKMPSITWDGTKAWVAWNDDSNQMRVAYYNGAGWTTIAAYGATSALFSTPDLLWANGALYAARQDASRNATVARWNGSAWVAQGTPGGGTGNTYPNLAWDGTELYVAWSSTGGQARVSRLVAGAWTAHSTEVVGDGAYSLLPSITFIDGRLYLARDSAVGASLGWWDGSDYRYTTPELLTGQTVFGYAVMEWTGTRMWVAYGSDPMTTRVAYADPLAPSLPTLAAQLESDASTAIVGGAWTRFGAVANLVLRARFADPQGSETLTPWVEVRTTGSGFAATCGITQAGSVWAGTGVAAPTAGTGVNAAATVTGLTTNTDYSWRACAVDSYGFPGPWLARGTPVDNTGSAPDLSVDSGAPAAAPTTPLAAATGLSPTPLLTATYTDPAPGLAGLVDFEICSNVTCGTVIRTGSSAAGIVSGSPASWTTPTPLAYSTTYYWRARATDSVGNVGVWSTPIRSFTTRAPSISVDITDVTIDAGMQAVGADDVVEFTAAVDSDDPQGYWLYGADQSDTAGATCACGNVPDWTGTDAVPSVWGSGVSGASGWAGLTVLDTTGIVDSRLAKWGTATTTGWPLGDFTNNRYAGLKQSTTTLLHQTAGVALADTARIAWRLNPSATTPAGSYSASVTVTVVGRP